MHSQNEGQIHEIQKANKSFQDIAYKMSTKDRHSYIQEYELMKLWYCLVPLSPELTSSRLLFSSEKFPIHKTVIFSVVYY
jgi:hypothetical protein